MLVESITHKGLVRHNNEDRSLVRTFEDGSVLLAVADGMGGHAAGEVAAGLAVECLKNFDPHAQGPAEGFLDSVEEAQKSILEASRADASLQGMGTTLTAVLVIGPTAYWAQVGDSRLYLFRRGVLEQKTEDHTIPGMLLKKGEISKEEARLHPYSNVLTRCLGCERFKPDTSLFAIHEGDLVLLSSDGLHDLIPDEEIAAVLGAENGLREKLEQMVAKCLQKGGKDNITAILARA